MFKQYSYNILTKYEGILHIFCPPCHAGTVIKLLQRINEETEIRLDVIDVPFPVESSESVRCKHQIATYMQCFIVSVVFHCVAIQSQTCMNKNLESRDLGARGLAPFTLSLLFSI